MKVFAGKVIDPRGVISETTRARKRATIWKAWLVDSDIVNSTNNQATSLAITNLILDFNKLRVVYSYALLHYIELCYSIVDISIVRVMPSSERSPS